MVVRVKVKTVLCCFSELRPIGERAKDALLGSSIADSRQAEQYARRDLVIVNPSYRGRG